MSTVTLSSLYPLIQMHAKKVPTPAIDIAVREAAREFCRRSRYRQLSIPVDLIANTSWYQIAPPNTDEELIRIENVQWNGQQYPVPLYSVDQASVSFPVNQQQPYVFFFEPPNKLVVLPATNSNLASGLYVRCVLQPTQTAMTLDFTLTQQDNLTLSYGALAFLLRTNESPWSDLKMAERYRELFDAGIADAASRRQTDFQSQNLLTAVQRF